jgi:hypothetical protein
MLHLSMYFKSESFYLLNVNNRIFLDSREDDVLNEEKENNENEKSGNWKGNHIKGDIFEGGERMPDINDEIVNRKDIYEEDVSIAECL